MQSLKSVLQWAQQLRAFPLTLLFASTCNLANPGLNFDKNQTCSIACQDILPCPDVSVKHEVSETNFPIRADFV